jgi:hypothetical protein
MGLTFFSLALIAFEIIALILWVPGNWYEAFADFRELMEDMTSPEIIRYVSTNFYFLAIVFSLIGAMFTKSSPDRPIVLYAYIIELIIFILAIPVLIPLAIVYALFHVFLISMLSYLPTVIASAVVARASRSRVVIDFGSKKILISKIFTKDELAAKGFLIGVPAAVLALISTIILPFVI